MSSQSRRLACWFQSHAGSIEAQTSQQAGFASILRFNPTLVRLRLHIPKRPTIEDKVSIPRWFD